MARSGHPSGPNVRALAWPAALLVGAAVAPGPVAAQLSEYRTLFIGEQAQGLATAYTGVANSPTAAFHNPAGLATARSTSLSSSLTLVNFDRLVIEDAVAGPAGQEDLDSRTGVGFPFSIGFNAKFGDPLGDGVKRNAIAFSTFSPIRQRLQLDATLIGGGETDSLRITREDRATWYGLSYARRLSDAVGLGLSLFFANRRVRHVESQTTFVQGTGTAPDGRFTESDLGTRDIETDLRARHLVARLGVLWTASERLQLGAMFQPPGLSLGSSASVEQLEANSDLTTTPPSSSIFQATKNDLDGALPLPWEVRVGVEWRLGETSFLSADAGMTGWQRDVVPVTLPDPEDDGDVPTSTGFFFPNEFTRRATGNLAVALSGALGPRVPFRGGLFFESPVTGPVKAQSEGYRPPRLWTVGASIGGGYQSTLIDLDVGVVVQLGIGDGLGLDPNRPDPGTPGYVRRDARRLVIMLFLGGYKNTAERLAQRAYEGLGLDLDGSKESEGDGEGGADGGGGEGDESGGASGDDAAGDE